MRLYNGGAEWYGCTFTAGVEGAVEADGIDVTIQLTDRVGKAVAKRIPLYVYPAVADGSKALSAVSASITVSTGTLIYRPVNSGTTGVHFIYPDVNGIVVIRFVTAGADTRTCVVILPDGRVVESATLTWAA